MEEPSKYSRVGAMIVRELGLTDKIGLLFESPLDETVTVS